MAKQNPKSANNTVSLITRLQNNPVWSPSLQDAVSSVQNMRGDFKDYITRVFRRRQRHAIVTGAPGTGKSYTIAALAKIYGLREGTANDRGRYDYTVIKGNMSAAKLHAMLYYHSKSGKILILDDCRNAEHDIECLTALNSAMDTTNPVVTRDRMSNLVDNGTIIPNQFKFAGSIIIVSNLFSTDRARMGSVKHTRYTSIMSRCQSFDFGSSDKQSIMANILDLAENENLFASASDKDVTEAFTWAVANLGEFKELSIRHMIEIMNLKTDPDLKDWRRLARRVMLKTTDQIEV